MIFLKFFLQISILAIEINLDHLHSVKMQKISENIFIVLDSRVPCTVISNRQFSRQRNIVLPEIVSNFGSRKI